MKTLTYLLFTLSFLFSNEINCQSWHSLIHEKQSNLLQESVSDNKGMIAYSLINKDIMGQYQNGEFFADSVIVRYGMYADQKWIYTYNEAGFVSTKTIKVLENGIFKISGLINYIYNQNNNLIEEVRFQWNDTVWVNSYRQIYEYNNNKITRWKTQMWYNNQWTNNYDNIYTYNNNEYLVLYEHNAWQQNTWEYRWKEEYTYNQSNQLDSLFEFFYSDDSTWRKNHLFKHEYSPVGNLETKYILVWNDTVWKINRKRTYEYDSINRLIKYAYNYLSENGWINYYKYDYAYDENDNMIYELHYYGEDTLWYYGIKTIMEYDEFNNKTSEYQYKFDTIDSTWYYHRFNDYYHDYLNNVSFVTTYIWDEDEWIVFSDYDLTFTLFGRTIVEHAIAHYIQCHYSGTLAGDKKIKYNPNIQINCFPNPATEILKIASPEIIEQIKIIDNSGKVVYDRDVNAERLVSINTTIFKPGVYYISVMTKKGITVEKVIIIF